MAIIHCSFPGCIRTFKQPGHLTLHMNLTHAQGPVAYPSPEAPLSPTFPEFLPISHSPPAQDPASTQSPSPHFQDQGKTYHPYLTGDICDENGSKIPSHTAPSPIQPIEASNPWAPFDGEAEFRLADHLFRKVEMSQKDVNELLDIWSLFQRQRAQRSGSDDNELGPFSEYCDMYGSIDDIHEGGAPWKCFQTSLDDTLPIDAPEWRKTSYQVWYRDPNTVISNILANPELSKDFDPAPYIHRDKHGTRRWCDFMSGNFAWRHATQIYNEEGNNVEGAMLVPVILSANKTTVSVATGHVEYHPLYLTIGNISNVVQQAHCNAVIPIAERKYDKDVNFRIFKKQLYHSSITAILKTLKPGMKVPVVCRCPDGHFQRLLLSGIVQGWCGRCTAPSSNLDAAADRCTRQLNEVLLDEYGGDRKILWDNYGIDDDVTPFMANFPRADIHKMLSPDLLHQIIKGCFKDMLVEWAYEYLVIMHGETEADKIMDDIDRRIALVPSFPGLRRFPHGRRFKQWTGDDSKALMKVYLPAVAEYLPEEMMKCLSSFLNFCYLVRRSDIDENLLNEIHTALNEFHHHHEAFRSRHITAVKKPWRRSSRFQALSQMLLTNQRIDKLLAFHSTLASRGLLLPRYVPPEIFDAERDDGYPRFIQALGIYIGQPTLEHLTRQFLHNELHKGSEPADNLDLPYIQSKINVYHSAVAVFYAPSDNSGIHGMKRERIRCTPSWRGVPRHDCVLVTLNEERAGFQGMSAARVLLLFSFVHESRTYPCALLHWYNTHGHSRDPKTGMWRVKPAFHDSRKQRPCLAVVHLNTLIHGVHLIPVYGPQAVPANGLKYYHSLDVFTAFYVSKYADYHASEIIL
ncbi:hypothetical protein BDP27DRAFT_1484790 [Rhodocollybia butyracea]|uniref:C2H2-type domain-containing protein n=1 Tax=Rhodocollybia butyracea TaxID=206335 RepID=A0A9P5PDH1_9AGAR|nr:hypothetical protein BDP27DRAFT_1484790 [Rhodocollybia butyracea]